MAYLLDIEKPRCSKCMKAATVYAYNSVNARNGAFCKQHGAEYVAKLDREERKRLA